MSPSNHARLVQQSRRHIQELETRLNSIDLKHDYDDVYHKVLVALEEEKKALAWLMTVPVKPPQRWTRKAL
ncbi:Uncharacterised protein [uncultured archaeon]|nr:Uncharacterised protein [uncultured archaeon]